MADPVPGVYSVELGHQVVTYRDDLGAIRFGFEIDLSGRESVLHHTPPHTPRLPHYDLAFALTRRELESRGYKIVEKGHAILPDEFTEEEVAAIVDEQLPDPFPLKFRLIVPPRQQEFLKQIGPSFQLWLVAEVIDGEHRGYRIVFDQINGHFGIVNEANVFLGFWGSLSQTFDAVGSVP